MQFVQRKHIVPMCFVGLTITNTLNNIIIDRLLQTTAYSRTS